ncbi:MULTISPECIES: oligosaccharide flippase family protein [Flavobacteriaceae]|uniref:oligosaccharide flippase family protein n=1 Tax=Flavobacteriaceae TaxID=49546 RepID=UPI0010AE9C7C|nr:MULTISPECIES: oligosaccharide flippase family protein [Flavobacteriaceae]NJB35509.1 oligosaccharide flippase family protein [Croceivirga sp. JEA036]TKD66187.1 lipopolysaccharide biosynthesis protein [Flavobacterium sp. ASW18X]
MGIVLRQSFKNTLITYMGFGIGAINILFLYTHILSDTYFGLVNFILATAAILMPLLAFGVHNTLVKFYTAQEEAEKDGFLTLMLLSPLLSSIPLASLVYLFYDSLAVYLSQKNILVKDYIWYLFLVGFGMAYFEVFYAWCKVFLKSVFGNFMKEVFARLCVLILLLFLYYNWISVAVFLKGLVGIYLLRSLIMMFYAYSLRKPKLSVRFPKATKEIMSYSMLIILGGSASLVLLEIDKFMINQFKTIENVAYYSVAVFIATVIIVPSRAMHQITYPLTATLINTNDTKELNVLYKKSSLTLLIASGLLFLLIVLNLNELYQLLPEEYAKGFSIVFIIGLAKVLESSGGNINSILYNSQYYKSVLVIGVLLAIATILLNLWLIPKYGIYGAALASFIALFIFNVVKVLFVKWKLQLWPYSIAILKTLILLVVLGAAFSVVILPWHPILAILVKSIAIIVSYVSALYLFKISEDITALLQKLFVRK